jgi:hypothetical protein
MKFILTVTFYLLTCSLVFSQSNFHIFKGTFDSCIIHAKNQNRNIFFITRSESCHVFDKFRTAIEADTNTINFLNTEFVVYEWDMDNTNDSQYKRLKKYYHSWRGFPQIYCLTNEESVIAEFVYSTKILHEDHLKIWKNYKNTINDWKKIKNKSKSKSFSYDELWEYIIYREMIYNVFGEIQINKRVSSYFEGIDTVLYPLRKHWILFKRHINLNDLGTNPELFDYVARNKVEFEKENDPKEVSDYLYNIYYSNLLGKKEKRIEKMSKKYPYNTIDEAKKAILNYKRNLIIQNIFD